MPGRPAGKRALLEQHHVGPAQLRQVVRRRAADHAAADDHDPGASGRSHRPRRRSNRRGLSSTTGSARRALDSTIGGRPVEEGVEVAAGEGAGGLVEPLHPPGVEVEVERAGGGLDEAPERPAVLRAQRLQVAPGPGTRRPRRRATPRPARRSARGSGRTRWRCCRARRPGRCCRSTRSRSARSARPSSMKLPASRSLLQGTVGPACAASARRTRSHCGAKSS